MAGARGQDLLRAELPLQLGDMFAVGALGVIDADQLGIRAQARRQAFGAAVADQRLIIADPAPVLVGVDIGDGAISTTRLAFSAPAEISAP